jgi:hypothetical protein
MSEKICPLMAVANAICKDYSYYCSEEQCALWTTPLHGSKKCAIKMISENLEDISTK